MNQPAWLKITASQIADLAKALRFETVQLLRFYTRFPIPPLSFEADPYAAPDFSKSIRSLPFVAIFIALPSVLIIALGVLIELPAPIIAVLAIAASALATGAFHEDGLADTADSIGGGISAKRRLEIMRDSRIGSYGSMALILVVMLKIFAISALLNRYGVSNTMLSVISAAMLSRVVGLFPHMILPSARQDGRSVDVGKPQPAPAFLAILISLIFCFIALADFGYLKITLAVLTIAALTFLICIWTKRKINGQTGDILGAIQQISEVTLLVALNSGL
jgi:adenosylcobinamide-GDP ribazoletransferase